MFEAFLARSYTSSKLIHKLFWYFGHSLWSRYFSENFVSITFFPQRI